MKKTLIVDDSMTMRRIIKNILSQLGYDDEDIYEAKDGEEAWELIQDIDLDLILTDWNMPNMNGLELVKKIKSDNNYSDIPILMITTEGGKSEVVTALKAGVDNYIVKPFGATVLQEKIKAVYED